VGDGTGARCSLPGSRNSPENRLSQIGTQAQPAGCLRLVPRRPAPVEVRISVADSRAPIGRSRLFQISPRDIPDLLQFAGRLERSA
jgi:hypothetical protein